MNENLEYEYMKTNVRPSFGGKTIEAVYVMTHTKNGRVNQYRVTCEIRGLRTCEPHMWADSAEFIGDMEKDSNDETLTEEAAKELFDTNTE